MKNLPLDYSKDIKKAVRSYWSAKSSALEKNQTGKRVDQGRRGSATAGKNLDGFVIMLERLIKREACKTLEIHRNKSNLILPGHFRPSKQWDLVVLHQGKLLAALELKSLGGPSFGNNANNRCEEALGSGYDISVAQREGLLGPGANPFIGYFILVEDAEASNRPAVRGNPSVHFQNDPIFEKASYQERMKILCERMMQERLYSSAAVMATPPSAHKSGNFKDLSKETSFNRFIAKLLATLSVETCS